MQKLNDVAVINFVMQVTLTQLFAPDSIIQIIWEPGLNEEG